jgi:alkanesulfonate monooxygenase SsuD/methylene tetrahydromethanopterin reductase-like flavin-dependent oxidoreductase (luciferase family)
MNETYATGWALWIHGVSPVPELVAVAVLAEELGASALLIADEGIDRDVYVTLAAVATATSRITLAPAITNPHSRHPVATAAALASLAELAPGRVVAGLGVGGNMVFGPLGLAPTRPFTALAETVDVIDRLLAGQTVDHRGQFVASHAAIPWSQGRLPIGIAGRGPRVLDLAAAKADWVILAGQPVDRVARLAERVRERAAAHGRRPGIVWNPSAAWRPDQVDELRAMFAFMVVDLPGPERAALQLSDELIDELRDVVHRNGPKAAAELVPDRVLRHYAIAGHRHEVIARRRRPWPRRARTSSRSTPTNTAPSSWPTSPRSPRRRDSAHNRRCTHQWRAVPRPMRIGVSPWGTSLDGIKQVAQAAAAAGLDTLWLGDGLLVVPDFPQFSGGMEPLIELAWLAGRHPNVQVGVGAAVLPLRDVLYLAKQAATLDQLTEGRFFLVLAPGFWEREFAYLGLPFNERGRRFDDVLGALRAAFNGSGYNGEQVQVPPAEAGRLSPAPLTPGGPPVWLAGARPTFERALKAGLPFQARTARPAELAPVAAEWFDRGGGELAVRIAIELANGVSASPAENGGAAQMNALVGPPSYIAQQLAAYRELGVADVSLMPGRDDRTSLRTVEALATEILPALRA